MATEKAPEAVEKKKPSPMIKVILLIVVILVVVTLSVAGTLFATGAFSKKPVDADLSEKDDGSVDAGHGEGAGSGGHGKPSDKGKADASKKSKDPAAKDDSPQKKPIPADSQVRFEKSYMELDDKKPLLANVSNSRKVMQVSLSLMTQYDDRVFKSVERHRTALRSVALDVLRQTTEADLAKPDFRTELAKQLRDRINSELTRLENFGGIEEVFFTEFVYQ